MALPVEIYGKDGESGDGVSGKRTEFVKTTVV